MKDRLRAGSWKQKLQEIYLERRHIFSGGREGMGAWGRFSPRPDTAGARSPSKEPQQGKGKLCLQGQSDQ